MSPPTCPRCDGPLRAPGLMSSGYQCDRHGAVTPLRTWTRPSAEVLRQVCAGSGVPVWAPLPMLPGWTVTGLAAATAPGAASCAVALALSGPSPLGGPADLVLVAEEAGVGLGARLCGVDALEPTVLATGTPDAKVLAAGHPTALWCVQSAADRVGFAGEAAGVWLRAVLWPPAAELLLLEHVELQDLRQETHAATLLPFGASTTRLGARAS